MKTKFLKNALVAGVILSASITGTAQADVLASSVIDVTNLLFLNADGSTIGADQFSSISYTNTGDVTTSLGGSGGTDSGNVPGIDLFRAQGDATGYTDNQFTTNLLSTASGLPGGLNYTIADQLESGAPITGLPDGNNGNLSTPAHVANASYAGITGNSAASSDSNNGLSSQFVFSGLNGVKAISFDFAYYLEVFVNQADAFPSFAEANYSFDMDIDSILLGTADYGQSLFSATVADGVALNAPTAVDTRIGQGLTTLGVAGSSSFLQNTGNFLIDSVYQLTFRINTNADVQRIPEPSILALLGLGLVGLGFSRRKAK